MKKNYIVFAILIAGVYACGVKKVPVSTTDNQPPYVTIFAGQNGITALRNNNHVQSELIEVAERDIAFIASGKDTLGLKSLTVEVVNNATLEIDNRLHQNYTKSFTPDSLNQAINQTFIGGKLHFDTPDNEAVLRSRAVDFAGNESITPTIRVKIVPSAAARLSANRTRIDRGESVALTWETDHANEARLNNNLLSTFNGSQIVTPQQTTSYILKAKNSVSTASDTVRVVVNQPPNMPSIQVFEAIPSTITQGASSSLNWSVSNVSNVEISPIGFSSQQSNGSTSVSPSTTTTYTLKAINTAGSVERNVTLQVDPPANMIECVEVPSIGLAFQYQTYNPSEQVFIYELDLRSLILFNNKPITSVKNLSNSTFTLKNQGISVFLRLNESTSDFNNLNFGSKWVMEIENQFVGLGPKIEFCYELTN